MGTPSFYVGSITNTTATIYVSHGDGYNAYRIWVRLPDDTNAFIDHKIESDRDFEYQITGLEPGTTYYSRVGYATSLSTTNWNTCDLYEFETIDDAGIDDWDWEKSNGDATAAETLKAYNAVANKGFITDFKYTVWNDMVNKAATVIELRGGQWVVDEESTTKENTLMTDSDRFMTALRFNSLRWNLGHYVETGTAKKSRGDDMIGKDFLLLAEAINNTIKQGNLNG